eukprot:1561723-Pleurochrysis_carterae.AAC.1
MALVACCSSTLHVYDRPIYVCEDEPEFRRDKVDTQSKDLYTSTDRRKGEEEEGRVQRMKRPNAPTEVPTSKKWAGSATR